MKPQDDAKPDEGQSRSTGVLEASEQDRFEKAMVDAGYTKPRRSQHGGYLYGDASMAWLAWQLAPNAKVTGA